MKTLTVLCCVAIVMGSLSLTMGAVKKNGAVSMLHSLGDYEAKGLVKIVEADNMLHITGEISGLEPGGSHGFHLHDFGDCSAPDGSTAGGHFNPGGHVHAGAKSAIRHFGDFGNVTADENGIVQLDILVPAASGITMVYGRGLILHAGADDEKTNPSGNSGPRIACGVVGISR